jgi:hypothetical protein
MPTESQDIGASKNTAQPVNPPAGYERRCQPRYRLAVPIRLYCPRDCKSIRAITLEISEGGFSAAVASPLLLGERVHVQPIPLASGTAVAQVKHQVGRLHGFSFLEISDEQVAKIRSGCRGLSLFGPNSLGI